MAEVKLPKKEIKSENYSIDKGSSPLSMSRTKVKPNASVQLNSGITNAAAFDVDSERNVPRVYDPKGLDDFHEGNVATQSVAQIKTGINPFKEHPHIGFKADFGLEKNLVRDVTTEQYRMPGYTVNGNYYPGRISNRHYISPFRQETNPSFKTGVELNTRMDKPHPDKRGVDFRGSNVGLGLEYSQNKLSPYLDAIVKNTGTIWENKHSLLESSGGMGINLGAAGDKLSLAGDLTLKGKKNGLSANIGGSIGAGSHNKVLQSVDEIKNNKISLNPEIHVGLKKDFIVGKKRETSKSNRNKFQ